jgi:hypothetical protein
MYNNLINMCVISLTTDFGLKDGNVGVMKGVILRIAPNAKIVDLTHQVTPQNVAEGALILDRSMPYFPANSIHIAVIDPGVGTARRPVAGRVGDKFFVGPDNGLFTLLVERAERADLPNEWVHLDNPRYWLPKISHVFHGRDIFAPCGAHLAIGTALADIGTPIHDLVRISMPGPISIPSGLLSEVIHIDHFGNISTSIRREHILTDASITIHIGGVEIKGLVNTFGEGQPGSLVGLFGSTDSLLVCEVNGNAAAHLGVKVGDPVAVHYL